MNLNTGSKVIVFVSKKHQKYNGNSDFVRRYNHWSYNRFKNKPLVIDEKKNASKFFFLLLCSPKDPIFHVFFFLFVPSRISLLLFVRPSVG